MAIIYFIPTLLAYLVGSTYCDTDINGYIVYCPCMGRFGNQAEQFLGSLLFAKRLNRSLVLPPFIEYNKFEVNLVPFKDYIKVEGIAAFHRVITMEDFMSNLAPIIWRPEKRTIICYSKRGGAEDGCNPFEGSPFKNFWHHFNITTFRSSLYHAPLTTSLDLTEEWKQRFRHIDVLAFVGAPAPFPVSSEALEMAKHVELSDDLARKAAEYRELRGFARVPYLAVHLRHGSDWIRACDLLKKNPMSQLFSSDQCMSKSLKQADAIIPYDLCHHSYNIILQNIREALQSKENVHNLTIVYIATDFDDTRLWERLRKDLQGVTIITPRATYGGRVTYGFEPPHHMIDIYLLVYSNHFLGNCVSSFSAFASRLRHYNLHFKGTTGFFAEEILYQNYSFIKDEL